MDRTTSLERFNTARNTLILLFFVVAAIALGVQYATSSESRKQLRRIIAKMKDILDGEGDLTKRISIAWFDEIGELSDHINRFIVNLSELLGQVSDVAAQVEDSSVRIRNSLEQASGAAEQCIRSPNRSKRTRKDKTSSPKTRTTNSKLYSALLKVSLKAWRASRLYRRDFEFH